MSGHRERIFCESRVPTEAASPTSSDNGEPSTYRTIVADPPWRTTAGSLQGRGEGFVGGDGKSKPLAYPTMSVDEIAALPVSDLAAQDCALYLWTTNGYLPAAFDVLAAWGFRYSTTLVWAKKPIGYGLGGCWGISTEFVLYARRGKPIEREKIGTTWFQWKRVYDERGKPLHSAKPPSLQDYAEQLHDGPRLEMFARSQRLGWDTWGNQALEHVDISPKVKHGVGKVVEVSERPPLTIGDAA